MYTVYILACKDGTLYTGITNDPQKRLAAHRAGTASKYTRSRGAVKFVYTERKRTKGSALSREAAIKKLTKKEKHSLVVGVKRKVR